MPRKASVTREQVLDAAVQLVREQGHERLTARALATRLGCSTQPVLYCFSTMDDLARATYARVDEIHSQALMDGLEQADDPMLQLGLNYVHFAQRESSWFRFLFQSNGLGQQDMLRLIKAPEIEPLVEVLRQSTGLEREQAYQVFLALFSCAHGLASMLANNTLTLDDESIAQVLGSAFVGTVAYVRGDVHD